MNEERPILKQKWSTGDKLLEVAGYLILILLWILVLSNYAALPETIPTHFGITGKADGFGNKGMIFMLPVVTTLLFVGMTILNYYPHKFNYPTKVTVQTAKKQYTVATHLIRYLKFIVVLAFFFITLFSMGSVNNQESQWFILFLFLFIISVFVPLIYGIYKLFHLSK